MLLTVITFIPIVSCYSTLIVPRDEKDFTDLQKQKADSPSNGFLLLRNFTPPKNLITQWQVDRLTRKQYDIINLLWRKTKIFLNVENTTPEYKQINLTKKVFDLIQGKHQIVFSAHPPTFQPVTPSYIEFYYSDESDDNEEKQQEQDCVNDKCQLQENTNRAPNSSFLVFHIKGPLLNRTKTNYYSTSLSPFTTPRISNDSAIKPILSKNISTRKSFVSSVTKTNEAAKENKQSKFKINTQSKSTRNITAFSVKEYQTESTTVYDKIKFFELYDKLTQVPLATKSNMLEFESNEHTDEEIKINNAHKILLEHVDQSSHENNEVKLSKKHIMENDKNSSQSCINTIEEIPKPKAFLLNISTERQNNLSLYNRSIQSEKNISKNVYSYINKPVSWLKYPFAAVYIYEPTQLHCDAASISAHWLVAAGSCLSRLNQIPLLGDGRSAFVAYCGDSWWQPERVSYVKYSVVHPWYHPNDRTRKNLYNIGVIQVVTSMMSACSDWAPVSLMSHQFAASREGSEASALGWGLDRYDTRYASTDIPKATLMIYKSLVLSDSCPGNNGYGKVKRLDRGGGLKNVYCLSLPPYLGEERDPVHGSLLLVGGKLIALYLQEERRPWGEQSAQYTGIWHLIPWVVEVAREPEEMESFTVDI